ncbi:hypothetical protein L207DRAFT_579476 [Hyaloscypha variabilis F]|uniref:Zn(2)-C6 fungal-type domain-containing protein n=1 Tax=Hyaloscypha variabilis (strain UAMH 11265 / GT02V1 / F) TaxID=1149755 RepID=A0A2J6S1B1_HYAVF|nr:hypothetical protein L207DRAFT_579476 [Hyaloscypha variabilis F]
MSCKQILLLQSPTLAYGPTGPPVNFEDPKRQELDVGFNRIFSGTLTWPNDRVLPPPRRAFQKSRRGCRTCKARKVKCDEEHPLCCNCARRYPGIESCDFEPFTQFTNRNNESVSISSRQQSHGSLPSIGKAVSVQPAGFSCSEGQRLLELRLMHHYTTSTCKEMPDGHSRKAKYIWSIDMPQLAFQNDLVLNALLGVSALHHWALKPDDPRLSYAAGYYIDRAVRSHRKALTAVDQASVESVLATAILITHYTWLSAHSNNAPYELHLQTYHMARSIQVLFEQMYPWVSDSGYLWYVERTPAIDIDEVACFDPFLLSSQEDLAKLAETFDEEDVTPTDKKVYEKAVVELTSMCVAICNGGSQVPLQRGVATLPLRLPDRFLELVELKDPRALVLLARNHSLLKVIEPVWWLHGTGGSQKVAEISITGLAKMLPLEWAWAMEWPFKVLAGDLRPSISDVG